jgi:hypothetical protein
MVLEAILGGRIIELYDMTATHVIRTIYTIISKVEVSGGQLT